MTSMISKFVFNKVLKETTANRQGRDEDPYYEVPAANLSRIGKHMRRRKRKALPPGLTEEEGLVLTKMKRRAYRLDMSLGSFLGMKVGWGGVIGLVPFIGDGVDCLLALMVIKTAMALELPNSLLIHMLINVAFDFLIGLIPFIGDLADIGYKCNTRNTVLLESYLRKKGAAALKAQGVNLDTVDDPSLPGYDSGPDDLESNVHGGETGTAMQTQGTTLATPAATYSGAGRSSGSRREERREGRRAEEPGVKHSKSRSKSLRKKEPPVNPRSTYR